MHTPPPAANRMPYPLMFEDQIPELLAALPQRISDTVAVWAERSPNHPALVESSGTWTYLQLADQISETRNWLLHLGVRPGDRVLIVCENCRAFAALLLAVAALDAWPVLVNARLSASEVDQIRDHSGARLAFYTTAVSPQAGQHAKRHGAVVEDKPGLGPVGIGPLNQGVKPEPLEPDPASRVAALIYTSGTTGLPKGVMLSHRNVLYVAAVSARIRSLTPEDRLYGILPMSHAVGLSVVFLGALLSGSTLYLAKRFDPVAALTALEKDRLSIVLGSPSMFSLLLDYLAMKDISSLNFPALRIISSSGAPATRPQGGGRESLRYGSLQRLRSYGVLAQHRSDPGRVATERYLGGTDPPRNGSSTRGFGWKYGPQRRNRRTLGTRAEYHEGLLSRARGNRRRHQPRWLVQHA